ncbi:MAG TPA: hypothetical protein VL093_09490 [Flavipsychrobacter sp.]|jgi:hypothetical protein|nr:hypothetical protein [Flavipsychrobacter sp.]
MNRLFISAILVLFTLGACNKDDGSKQQLPPLTQEGKNILACKVNGQVHIYSGKRTTFDDNGVNYDRGIDKVRIAADNSRYNDNIEIILPYIPDSVMVGVRYYFTENEVASGYASYYVGNGSLVYKTSNKSGFIQFNRLDENIAAGVFEYIACHNNDSIKITEGRFDITNP